VDPGVAGRGLYFSYGYDVTHNQQGAALAAASNAGGNWATQLPVQRANPRFFWNRAMVMPLLVAAKGVERWVGGL
jgi:hypothetical protein